MNEEQVTMDVENIDEQIDSGVSTDSIENFDFSSDKVFNIDESHELIKMLEKQDPSDDDKEYIKLREAKNIIDNTAKKYLDEKFVDSYTKEEENLINLIKKYDPNLDSVKSMSEEDKDKVYDIAQYLFNVFQKKLNQLNFNFPLTNTEFKLVNDIFRQKLEYDQNEVFQMKELKANYFDVDFPFDSGVHDTFINVNDLIIFYHLFAKYKVKGITSDYYNFVEVLTKIGERIKLFNAYNVVVQRLSTDFQVWGGALSFENVPAVGGEVLEPINDVNTKVPLSRVDVEEEKVN